MNGQAVTVFVGDRACLVTFDVAHHRPYLTVPGRYSERRVTATTRCRIEVGDYPAFVGEAHCAAGDRYRYARGCALALERAALRLAVTTNGPDDTVEDVTRVLREFRAGVMPTVGSRQAEMDRRRSRPSEVRVLRRAFDDLAEKVALTLLLHQHPLPVFKAALVEEALEDAVRRQP